MELTVQIGEHDIKKQAPTILTSSKNPTPMETIFLSNIDQTVAFPVETVYFYEAPQGKKGLEHEDMQEEIMRNAVTEVLIPYYFMAGRLNFNVHTKRLELVCNNEGAHFMFATSPLELKDLGNVSAPNPSFKHLVLRTDGFKNLNETPLLTIQVTKFKCGGFSVGIVTNHSILDGKSACDIFNNLASIYRGGGLMTCAPNNDRSCFRARVPPQINFPHNEYTKLADVTSANSSFTSPDLPSPSISLFNVQDTNSYRVFSFSGQIIQSLKDRALTKCSTFEAIVAHIWKARTRAVFGDPNEISSVLFAVDVRSKVSPPVPDGFIGNAVITACASAKVADLEEMPFSFCVKMVKEAIGRVTNEYVRSVIDWLEVYKGIPSTSNGNFYVSAWWKLPLHDLDFGYGRPVYGGPVVSGRDEFVLLLSDGKWKEEGGGINAWIGLEKQKMEKFMMHVYDI